MGLEALRTYRTATPSRRANLWPRSPPPTEGTPVPIPSLPPLTVSTTMPRGTEVLVVGLSETAGYGVPEAVDKAYLKKHGIGVAELARQVGGQAKPGSSVVLSSASDGPRLVVVGVSEAEPSLEDFRRAAGVGVRRAVELAGDGAVTVAVSLGADEREAVRAVAEGALLGSYRYAPVSTKAGGGSVASLAVLTAAVGRTAVGDVASEASVMARAVVAARHWVNLPPNLLFPASFAEEARGLVKDSRIAVDVLDEKALVKGGYGGIMAVGGGSSRPPRLVQLRYAPRGAKVHLALVGKGVTFDSGGLNLKPGDSMYTMRCDMAGAATVLAATYAIAELGLKVQVTAYGSLVENMPSDTAYRPSDVLTMYGGMTVENGNTDAEGRLVLADALVKASEEKPDLLLDVATLTGACIVALGDKTAGLMTTDDHTADQILDAAEGAGEDVWQLPIPKDIRPKLDSKVADIRSTAGGDRAGGALVAAAFLREFVGEGIPWAHLDIAGPAFNDGSPFGHTPNGGTGFGVRTLVALARSLEG